MKQHTQAKMQVLDRILHLLQERSVSQLVTQDEHFATFVDELYEKIDNQSSNLQRQTSR